MHGGGPQISAHLDRLGMESTFRAGLRVTTTEAMDVVRMVLTGQVNRDVVGLINRHGPFAVGLSGEDAQLLTARRVGATTADGEVIDIGHVGEVVSVNPGAVSALIADGRIPVISTRRPQRRRRGAQRQRRHRGGGAGGRARRGQDRAADRRRRAVRELARRAPEADGASPVEAGRPAEVISELTATDLAAMLPGLSGGMIPKMQACLTAVRGGVPQAHVLDGRLPHAVLLEIFTDSGIGTMVVPDGEAARSA